MDLVTFKASFLQSSLETRVIHHCKIILQYTSNQRCDTASTKICWFGVGEISCTCLTLKDQLYGFCDLVLWEYMQGMYSEKLAFLKQELGNLRSPNS